MTDFIPAQWRKPLYGVFALVSLALGATQVGYSAAGAEQPMWLTVSIAVYGFVAAGVGATAMANTVKPTATVSGIPESDLGFRSEVVETPENTPAKHAA